MTASKHSIKHKNMLPVSSNSDNESHRLLTRPCQAATMQNKHKCVRMWKQFVRLIPSANIKGGGVIND